jgi:hypothetical protein
LWTFHLYGAIFQQHLHMEYIQKLVVPIRIFFTEGYCIQGSFW